MSLFDNLEFDFEWNSSGRMVNLLIAIMCFEQMAQYG